MSDSEMSKEDVPRAVERAVARIALLHIAFSKVLIEEHGRERGLDLIAKALIGFGKMCAEQLQKESPDLTALGWYEESGETEDGKLFAKGCTLAKVFKEQDALDVGHMYCYVDAARTMAMQPEAKMIHITCETCGDDKCTVDIVPTTEGEQRAFVNRDSSWRQVDPRLFEFG